ncbi:MAG: hypothetical protein ACREHV_11750, partial [Rhizomicrobium sp.]
MGNFDLRQQDLSRAVSGMRDREEAAASARLNLESSVAELKSRFGEIAADNRYVALERSLAELAGRTESSEGGLAAMRARSGTVDDLLHQFAERFESDSRKQQDALADLKASLLGATSQAVGEKLEAESRKQQDAIAELKSSLFDELSRTLDERLEADERKQQASIEQLNASFLDDALRPFRDKLDAEGRKQHEAVELEASLSPAPALVQEAAADPAPVLLQDAHVPSSDEPVPPIVVTEPHDSILELTTPMHPVQESVEMDAAGHDEHSDSTMAPPPFPEPAFAASAPLSADIGLEALPPSPAFALDEPGNQPSPPSSYLAAARQSLQAASAKSEAETKGKELFGFQFLRPAKREKGKSETTSYALLAGIVLVAILAVAITVGELIGRSAPGADAHPSTAVAPTPRTTLHSSAGSATHAVAKSPLAQAGATNANRLAMLANAGDAEAQTLLGLQELGGANKAGAASWLERAAVRGEAVAQYRLGTLYAEGHGVPADPAKAFRWYAAAAKGGNRKAMSNLAVAYAQGAGTAKNPQEAALWFSKAAALGLVDAQFDLAILYERGLGVPQSLIDAYRWYVIA